MKALILILAPMVAQIVSANNACFDDAVVKALILASEQLDRCFKDGNNCNYENRSVEEQKARNARRLIPVDRSKNDFLNDATGRITIAFGVYDGKYSKGTARATAQKISSCHIITSAHALYKDAKFPINSENYTINFHSGQTCNPSKPFENQVSGKVIFKMMDETRGDFGCATNDMDGNCKLRKFDANSDLVIIKLDKYTKGDSNYFTPNTVNPNRYADGQRVNCWGYPTQLPQQKISMEKTNMFLWYQKDAQFFSSLSYHPDRGYPTNAILYHGMSGGGCSTSSNPRELVGVLTNDIAGNGHSAISIKTNGVVDQGVIFFSGFHKLEERYREASKGKSVADLESECK